jgi:hypothetical protein
MKNVSDTLLEKIDTNILYSNPFFEIRNFGEMVWKNIGELGMSQITIWRCTFHA